jgi:predicted N-acyltransferase
MREKKLEVKTLETKAELLELYEIHTDWNRRKGRTPESFEKFQMAASLTDHRKIFLALHDGKVVAGTFFRFCRGGIIEGSANHSIPEYQKLAPNELIMWRAIEWACADGFKLFSMGASHHFLTKFGGEIVANYRYRSDRTILKLHNNRERLSRLAIRTYQSLPVSIRQGIKSVATRV